MHVWEVEPGDEATWPSRFDKMFGGDSTKIRGLSRHTCGRPMTTLRSRPSWRCESAEDRQRLEQSGHIRETLDHLHGAANVVVRLYHEAASYRA